MATKLAGNRNEDKLLDMIILALLGIVAVLMLYPLLNIISISVSSYKSYLLNPLMFFPVDLDFSAFIYVFTSPNMLRSYLNTLFITGAGTLIGMFMISITAYPLSRKGLRGKKYLMTFYIIIMLFPGGIIPEYLVIKGIGLYDSLWALILPSLIPIYNLILMKSFFESIPESLIEAAKMDGAPEFYIYYKIILPLSKPALAAISMFLGILYWNDYFKAVLFIRSDKNWPVQLLLREIITNASSALYANEMVKPQDIYTKSVQYACLVVVILPVVIIYPFVQKFFVKGVMIGAVKG